MAPRFLLLCVLVAAGCKPAATEPAPAPPRAETGGPPPPAAWASVLEAGCPRIQPCLDLAAKFTGEAPGSEPGSFLRLADPQAPFRIELVADDQTFEWAGGVALATPGEQWKTELDARLEAVDGTEWHAPDQAHWFASDGAHVWMASAAGVAARQLAQPWPTPDHGDDIILYGDLDMTAIPAPLMGESVGRIDNPLARAQLTGARRAQGTVRRSENARVHAALTLEMKEGAQFGEAIQAMASLKPRLERLFDAQAPVYLHAIYRPDLFPDFAARAEQAAAQGRGVIADLKAQLGDDAIYWETLLTELVGLMADIANSDSVEFAGALESNDAGPQVIFAVTGAKAKRWNAVAKALAELGAQGQAPPTWPSVTVEERQGRSVAMFRLEDDLGPFEGGLGVAVVAEGDIAVAAIGEGPPPAATANRTLQRALGLAEQPMSAWFTARVNLPALGRGLARISPMAAIPLATMSDAMGRVEILATTQGREVTYEVEMHPDLVRMIAGNED